MKGQMSGPGSTKGPEINRFDKHSKEGRTRPIAVVDSSRVPGEVIVETNRTEDSIVQVLEGVRRSQEIASVDDIIKQNLRKEVDETNDYSFEDIIDEVENDARNIPEQRQPIETAPMGSGLIGEDSLANPVEALAQYARLEQMISGEEIRIQEDVDGGSQNVLEEQTNDSVSKFLNNIQGSPVVKQRRVSQETRTKEFRKVTKDLPTSGPKPQDVVTKESSNVLEGEDFIFTDQDCVNFPDRLVASGKLDLSQVSNDVLGGLVSNKTLDRIQVNRFILSSHVDDRVLQEIRKYERGENILGQVEFSDNGVLDDEEKLENFAGLFDDRD